MGCGISKQNPQNHTVPPSKPATTASPVLQPVPSANCVVTTKAGLKPSKQYETAPKSKTKCSCGCGRCVNTSKSKGEFQTCCQTCVHLKKEGNHVRGHDIACDVRSNDGLSHPWYWRSRSNASNPDFHTQISGEYVRKLGEKLLHATMPAAKVVQCERVEDSKLWMRYAKKRAELRNRPCPANICDVSPETTKLLSCSASTTIDRSVNEMWLFHATSFEAAQAIAKSSFSLNHARGGNFGKGCYFADRASKSNQYARVIPASTSDGSSPPTAVVGKKVMMLCRVVMGCIMDITATGRSDSNAHSYSIAHGGKYDSVLGTTGNREFLIYDVSQVYPEYLLFYD